MHGLCFGTKRIEQARVRNRLFSSFFKDKTFLLVLLTSIVTLLQDALDSTPDEEGVKDAFFIFL